MSKIFIDIPHAGRLIPDDWLYYCPESALILGQDRYVDLLVQGVRANQVLYQPFHRVYCDVNSDPRDIILDTPYSMPRMALKGRGILWKSAHGSFVSHIDLPEYQKRLMRVYWPYVNQLVDNLHQHDVWIQFHSMQKKSSHGWHPDIVLGSLNGRTCSLDWLKYCTEFWSTKGYDVMCDWPFAGGYLMKKYHHLVSRALQVEINKSLYLNQRGEPDQARVARLRRDIDLFIDYVSDISPSSWFRALDCR